MKNILLVFALLSSGTALAQEELPRHATPKQSRYDADVWDVTQNQTLPLFYMQPREMQQALEKDAKLKMWGPAQLEEATALLPAGGQLITQVGGTIETADPGNFIFVVQDSVGVEVLRFQPQSAVPRYYSGGTYIGTVVVPLPRRIGPNYRVFAINQAKRKRHEYLIRPL